MNKRGQDPRIAPKKGNTISNDNDGTGQQAQETPRASRWRGAVNDQTLAATQSEERTQRMSMPDRERMYMIVVHERGETYLMTRNGNSKAKNDELTKLQALIEYIGAQTERTIEMAKLNDLTISPTGARYSMKNRSKELYNVPMDETLRGHADALRSEIETKQ